MSKRTVSKAARLVLLLRLRQQGVLEDLTYAAIGDVFGVNRSTILRDMEELDLVEEEYQRLMATQPWVRRELTTAEFAEEIGASPQTVRYLIRDGLIEARMRSHRWWIPVRELERFKAAITLEDAA